MCVCVYVCVCVCLCVCVCVCVYILFCIYSFFTTYFSDGHGRTLSFPIPRFKDIATTQLTVRSEEDDILLLKLSRHLTLHTVKIQKTSKLTLSPVMATCLKIIHHEGGSECQLGGNCQRKTITKWDEIVNTWCDNSQMKNPN